MPNYTKETMGEHTGPGSFRAFRTVTDRPPLRTAVAALPEHPPAHFYEGIRDAGLVHVIGPDQDDQARAITYGALPDLRRGRQTWAADLTGMQVTEDLTARAINEGYGTYHWPDVSPTRIVAFHDSEQAAQLIVESMERTDRDPEIDAARVTHLTRVFDTLNSDVPLLGQGYNAVGVALRASASLRDSQHPLVEQEEDRIRDLYATPDARDRAKVILGPLHEHLENLIRKDDFSEAVYIPGEGSDHVLMNYGVLDAPRRLGPIRRLLVGHFDIRTTNPKPDTGPLPNTVIIAGAEHAYPDTLRHLQTTNGRNGNRTFLVFGGVNDTTKSVIGTDRAVTGSLGGLTGPEAEEVADAYGKSWKSAVTAKSDHRGSSGSSSILGGDGKTTQLSNDTTVGFDNRHDFPADQVRIVKPGTVTLAQGKRVWPSVPLAPEDAVHDVIADRRPPPNDDDRGKDIASKRFTWRR